MAPSFWTPNFHPSHPPVVLDELAAMEADAEAGWEADEMYPYEDETEEEDDEWDEQHEHVENGVNGEAEAEAEAEAVHPDEDEGEEDEGEEDEEEEEEDEEEEDEDEGEEDEDEMEESEAEAEWDEQHEHEEDGGNGEAVLADFGYTDDEEEDEACGYNKLTLTYPGGEHIFASVPPAKVRAALLLRGGLELRDFRHQTTVLPPSRSRLTVTYRYNVYELDPVTPDEVQDMLLSLAGSELLVSMIKLKLFFFSRPPNHHLFDSVSPNKVQAALLLLEGMNLSVSMVVPRALDNQLTGPLMCKIFVYDFASPDKVEAILSVLRERELNPGIGGGATPSIPFRSFVQSINRAW